MSHTAQKQFVKDLKEKYPEYFDSKKVLEVGSLNVNGTIRDLFTDCDYIGCDLGGGKDVDVMCAGEDLDYPSGTFDVVCSCECFEHNRNYQETLTNMIRMLKKGGLVFFTCATEGRGEHGTTKSSPMDSPFTQDYYKNLKEEDFIIEDLKEYTFIVKGHDLQFYGFK